MQRATFTLSLLSSTGVRVNRMRSLRGLSDEGLLSGLGRSVGSENEQKAETRRYLEEVERRDLHLRLGYSSLFKFCIERYRMSEPSASKRIGAMRTARRFPIVREMIARGELHLAGLHVLKAHLTPENMRRAGSPPRLLSEAPLSSQLRASRHARRGRQA
jgi:hypothetical protein